jgi:RimJ/RimL family protein N-acetyltransferase
MQVETQRLVLRRLQITDAPELFRAVGDPDVMAYWWGGADKSIGSTERRIVEIETHWMVHGFGDWGVVEKKSGRLIGLCGLHYLAGMAEVNIGYAFCFCANTRCSTRPRWLRPSQGRLRIES